MKFTLDLTTVIISPYDYGLAGGDRIAWGFSGVIDSAAFSADASQVAPEPSAWAMLRTGAFGRRRHSI